MDYCYLKKDKKTETRDYNLAGLWILEKAVKVCISGENRILAPDTSNRWLVLVIKEWQLKKGVQ